MTEKEINNREELLKLIRENPDLPIVPMVSYDVVAEDYGYWSGVWGSACVDEYLLAEREERILFKSDDDVDDTLCAYLGDEEYESLPESLDECRPFYDKLPWIKAIIVRIELLE